MADRPDASRTALPLILLCVSLLPGPTFAVETQAPSTGAGGYAHVTYISGSSIYVDAGRDNGLTKGDMLPFFGGDERVGVLRVKYLSAKRASCELAEGDPPRVGDAVPVADAPDASADYERTAQGDDAPPAVVSGDPVGIARVSRVEQETVYVSSGENRGLETGDRLRVLHGSDTVAELEVTDLSPDQAACKIIDGIGGFEVGDLVRIPIRFGDGDSGPVPTLSGGETVMVVPPPAVPGASAGTPASVNGRLGLRYLYVTDRGSDTTGTTLSQPALDLRLDGNHLAHGHVDLAVDVRSRRTYRTRITSDAETEDQTRVYRLAAAVHDRRGRYRFTFGRQFSPSLASVSTFDGVMADFSGVHWGTGIFAGTQPDPLDYGHSNEITEYGTFVQVRNRRGRPTQWSVTLGAIGSYVHGTVNREYAYLQALFSNRRISFYASQEMDYNRDWKVLAGEDPVDLTSGYLTLGYRVGRGTALRVGYDNRRNIRLYRDLITPETDFDDSFRTGGWVGLNQRVSRHFRFGLSAKRSTSEISGDADSYTMNLGANGITRARLAFFYRGTYYSNENTEGSLHSLTSGVGLTQWARLTVIGGLRQSVGLAESAVDEQVVWYGMEMDFSLGRHWFLQLSGERTVGFLETNDQGYFSTTYRF